MLVLGLKMFHLPNLPQLQEFVQKGLRHFLVFFEP